MTTVYLQYNGLLDADAVGLQRQYMLTPDKISVIGRGSNVEATSELNVCKLNATKVPDIPRLVISNTHCRLWCKNKIWWIENLSDNGTFLNDKKLEKARTANLKDGDKLCFDNKDFYRFVFTDRNSTLKRKRENLAPSTITAPVIDALEKWTKDSKEELAKAFMDAYSVAAGKRKSMENPICFQYDGFLAPEVVGLSAFYYMAPLMKTVVGRCGEIEASNEQNLCIVDATKVPDMPRLAIANKQFIVRCDAGTWYIKNLSTNTFLNRKQLAIEEETELNVGDVVGLDARYFYRFVVTQANKRMPDSVLTDFDEATKTLVDSCFEALTNKATDTLEAWTAEKNEEESNRLAKQFRIVLKDARDVEILIENSWQAIKEYKTFSARADHWYNDWYQAHFVTLGVYKTASELRTTTIQDSINCYTNWANNHSDADAARRRFNEALQAARDSAKRQLDKLQTEKM